MNSTRDSVRSSFTSLATGRCLPPLPRAGSACLSRAGLPVVSNRAFITAWAARRNKLVAAAQAGRAN